MKAATGSLKDFAGQLVSYRRGDASAGLTAVHSRRDYELTDGVGGVEMFSSDDWLLAAADLVLDGSQVTPDEGDRIRQTIGQIVYIFEVMGRPGWPHFNFCDTAGVRLRIHTRLIGQEAA